MYGVRLAIEPDAEGVCAVDRDVLGNDERRVALVAAIQAGECLVATTPERVAGFALFDHSFFGHGFVRLVVVAPVERRRGVATALIREAAQRCRTAKLFTTTNRSNAAMQAVCAALGFVPSGVIENLDEGDPELVYFRQLGARTDPSDSRG